MSGQDNDPNNTEKPTGRATYAGGFNAVVRQMEERRAPMRYAEGEGLPPLDCDLDALRDAVIGPVPTSLLHSSSSFAHKCRALHAEFQGKPVLGYLNALLIANLRRRGQPDHTAALFQRLWAEHADFLLAELNTRWLVSSITTFGDHGTNEIQRRVGHALTVLFSMMKLYETERVYSGATADAPFSLAGKVRSELPLEMDAFSIAGGGLDVNMLGRLWVDAGGDPVIAPLAHHLLNALNDDERNVFRRLRLMREARAAAIAAKAESNAAAPLFDVRSRVKMNPVAVPRKVKTDPAAINWGVVATVKAPLRRIARFAAWHLEQGAAQIELYLDAADPDQAAFLAAHPKCRVTLCDDAYWATQPRRPKAHQLRQVANATRSYYASELDWVASIDVDEFLLPDRPVAALLAEMPKDMAVMMIPPVEMLARTDPEGPELFKTTARMGGQSKRVLDEIYPTFGPHLRGGYISHLEGKYFVRTGLSDVKMSIHGVTVGALPVSNWVIVNGSYLGHAHAPSYQAFLDHLNFRMEHGSYRNRDGRDFHMSDVIDFLRENEGEDGLRLFYEEVCTATPRLVDALDERGMLVRRDMPLDDLVIRHFGAMPPGGM